MGSITTVRTALPMMPQPDAAQQITRTVKTGGFGAMTRILAITPNNPEGAGRCQIR
jgi:hypothetical protein